MLLKSLFVSFVLMPLFLLYVQPVFGQVKVWEGTITIPTYGWEDDVNPKFWAMEAGAKGATTVKASITYPYNMQDHLSRKLEDVTYKAVFIENEFLKITCLPELGGRLHSIYDKTTNSEAFHRNDVIKPSMIAMRGAFISGGIEWNAGPQVHTVTILSPVDVVHGENEDGSAYLEISNLEKSLRTQWTVRVTLHPGKSYIDEHIELYNPTDALNPYYFWNCTAFPQKKGTRFIYPMSLGTDHFGVEFFDWPVNDGVDLSWTKNYIEAASIFAVDCPYDFFGAYDVDFDKGIVQVANRYEVPGKKAWTWGQGEYGRVSLKNLGDEDPEYVEVQSGPLQTQSDYGLLSPGSSVSWTEYWYPVHDLKTGFEYATEKVAVQTEHRGNNLQISMIATATYDNADCIILAGDREIDRRSVDLSPASGVTLDMNKGNSDTVSVVITSGSETLAQFRSPLPMPSIEPPSPPAYVDKSDADLLTEENYLKAQKFDRALNRLQARKYYEAALALDPLHLESLRDLAILDFEAGLYQKAKEGLTRAVNQIPNDDGLAWYFLGLCQWQDHDTEAALKSAFKASKCNGTEARGFDLAGLIYMNEHQYNEAEKYFNKALISNPNDALIFHHLIMTHYAKGEIDEVKKLSENRIEAHPTELVPHFMLHIIESSSGNRIEKIRDFVGEDDFEILETSLVFSKAGLIEEAIDILESGCIEPVPESDQNHLVMYQLAYLYHLANEDQNSALYLKNATNSYKDFINASRREMEHALLYATETNPDDAVALYQLGNLYANFGRLGEAQTFWNRCVKADPSLSIPWRNLGLYHWVIENDHARAEVCYRNAIKARELDQTLYRDLARVLDDEGKVKEAIKLLEGMKYKGTQRSDIIIDLAQYYLKDEKYDECIDLLASTPYFVNWEGSSITWDIFNEANVRKGIVQYDNGKYQQALQTFETALTFPENLGVGQSMRTEEAKAWFWKGKTLLALGNDKGAVEAWKSGAATFDGSEEQNHYKGLCAELQN